MLENIKEIVKKSGSNWKWVNIATIQISWVRYYLVVDERQQITIDHTLVKKKTDIFIEFSNMK